MGSKRRRAAAAAAADEAPKENVKAVATPPAKTDEGVKPKKKKSKTASAVEPQAPPAAVAPAKAPTSAADDGKKKNKKNKSKSNGAAPTPTPVVPAVKPAEKAAGLKKKSNEIDDLFQSLKSKKKEQIEAEEKQKLDEKKALAKQKKEKKLLDEQIKKLEAATTTGMNPEARPGTKEYSLIDDCDAWSYWWIINLTGVLLLTITVRYDEDGLPIYTEDSLRINQGGDTADCPFDCWCCF